MPLLIDALNDESAEVRYGAIISMGNLGNEDAIAPLKKRRRVEENEELIQFIDQALEMLNSME
jgi:HEAT repeat protein